MSKFVGMSGKVYELMYDRADSDVEYAMMRENVATFRECIEEFLRSGKGWPCACCGQQRPVPADGWWHANDLRDATQCGGPSAMVAINEMVADGTLKMNERLQVRLQEAPVS